MRLSCGIVAAAHPHRRRRRFATSRRPTFRCPARPASGTTFHVHFDAPVLASKASMNPPPWPLPLMMMSPLAANGIGPWKRLPCCDGRASHSGLPVRRVERDERGILRDHVHHVAVDADAALPADARRLPHVLPDEASRRGVERVHAVVLTDIHHALVDDGRRLEILRTGQVKDPFRLQGGDVRGVDLLQWRMPLRIVQFLSTAGSRSDRDSAGPCRSPARRPPHTDRRRVRR